MISEEVKTERSKIGEIRYYDITEKIVMMRWEKIPFNHGNVICIEQKEGLVFVDAGLIEDFTRQFREEMEDKYGKETKMLLLTHTHGDHIMGMNAFADVPIVVTKEGMKAFEEMAEKGNFTREGRKKEMAELVEDIRKEGGEPAKHMIDYYIPTFIESEVFYPTITSDELIIGSAEEKMIYTSIGGHSECSAIIHIPAEKMLIAGDNLNSEHSINSGCMLAGAISSVKQMEKMYEIDAEKYILGHGPCVNKAYFRKTIDFFAEALKVLKKLKDEGVPAEEIANHPEMPEFFEEEKHKQWEFIISHWYANIEKYV
ncbi:MAG: MBL fold metallo-hydrolase [Candidatus Kariarchaeaceae archaeon]